MTPRTLIIPLALLALLGVGVLAWRHLMENKPVDVTFTTLKGGKIDLKELRGAPVLVAFWASDCDTCMAEMPALASLYEQYSPRGFRLIGVAMDYDVPRQVVEITEGKHLPFPVAYDLQGRYAKAFGGVQWVPDGFLLGPDGDIIYRWQGLPDLPLLQSKIEHWLKKV